jgi:hypothetical protein
MKPMWQQVKILKIQEVENKTFLGVATNLSKEDILKYATNQGLFAVIKFWDSRRITEVQRKMIFATCKDIADYIGELKELVRSDLISSFSEDAGIDFFSLSDCSLEIAREFINYIMEYVIKNDIPLTGRGIDRTDDIDKYLYSCISHEKCCLCGKQGVIYTVTKGNKICLCNKDYESAKTKGLDEVEKMYKVYPIRIKETERDEKSIL